MPDNESITTQTVAAMAEQLVGVSLTKAEQASVAGLLNALATDMQAMREMEVAANEPATVYEPNEP